MEYIKEYYVQLYKSQNIAKTKVDEYLRKIPCKEISKEYKTLCDEYISQE